eukprot:gene5713-9533_t
MVELQENTISFYVNGKKHEVTNPDACMTLLEYLRQTGHTGTKLGCGEGGCGACQCMMSYYENDKIVNRSVNTCLFPLCAADAMAIITVEGIGDSNNMHPVQEALSTKHASQCGFCTPGFVMALYTLLRNHPYPTEHQIEECFDGNLCRCTGYRPIIEAAYTFVKNKPKDGGNICPSSGLPCECKKQVEHSCETKKISEKVIKQWIFPVELRKRKDRPISIESKDGKNWFRPTSMEAFLKIKKKYPKMKIVGGFTELGIESKFGFFNFNFEYSTLVSPFSVPEMTKIIEDKYGVHFGCSVRLTDLKEYSHARETDGSNSARLFKCITNQLKWFSGTAVRNVSTLGGNIATASPISDLNPIWCAMNAILKIVKTDGTSRKLPIREFFLGYRKTDLKEDEIIESIYVPYTRENEFVLPFKQARRREDDIAIVTCGLRVKLNKVKDDFIVEEVGLAYGGMSIITKCAKKTEEFLIGKSWNDKTFEEATQILSSEFKLDVQVPGGMPHFRQALVLTFFYKFYLKVSHECLNNVPEDLKSILTEEGDEEDKKTKFKMEQTFDKVQKGTSVGISKMHNSGPLQVTGQATYTDDVPLAKNELFAAIVFSTIPHGKIIEIDASEALKMDQVVGFYTAKDVQGENKWGAIIPDEEVFITETVTSIGQIIGLVVAESEAQAKFASKKVKVKYEELPAILSIDEAIKQKSFLSEGIIHDGDVDAAFKNDCDHIIEGEIKMGGQEHFYLETMGCIAYPGENDEMLIVSSSQNLTETQKVVAHVLGLSDHKIVAKVKRIGGGFGGKETRTNPLSAVAAVAAKDLNQPIRLILNRDSDFCFSGHRHPFFGKYKVGVKKDGKLVALDVEVYNNAGYSLDLSRSVLDRSLFHIDNCYKFPNLRVTGRVCKTNLPSNTAFRGFGGPQGMMICENIMDQVSAELKLNKHKFREMNFYKENEKTHFGQTLDFFRINGIWKDALEKIDIEKKTKEIEDFNKKNKLKKRGISMIPTKFGIAFTALFLNQGGALVHIYTDGSVLVTHGGVEMGQGLHIKVMQVAATILGCEIESVFISETSTDKVPNTSPTAASMGSDLYCAAVQDACEQIQNRLKPYYEKNKNATFKEVVSSAYFDRINLSAQGFYKPDMITQYTFTEDGKGTGIPFCYFTQGVGYSEVEVDCLTGDFRILNSEIFMDVGESINPSIDIGQIEGAFIQGLGLFTMEELIYGDEEHKWVKPGTLLTRGPGNYKIPSLDDVPRNFSVHLMPKLPNKYAVMRSKAVGEPPLFLASAAFYAIKDAIYEFRKENNCDGYFLMDSPATCERIKIKFNQL